MDRRSIYFGKWNCKPIKWLEIQNIGNVSLFISNKGICRMSFHTKNEGITWYGSDLRKWLNDTFYNNAFSEEEKQYIIRTIYTADEKPTWQTWDYLDYYFDNGDVSLFDADDYISLLSANEAKRFLNREERKIEGSWWLRSPGSHPQSAAHVGCGGSVMRRGHNIRHNIIVRPIMILKNIFE